MKLGQIFLVMALAAATNISNAALYDRGNGMIYDSHFNITWLQDSNYAQTSGYDADGLMTWEKSTDWAANLVYSGFSDWRLSSAGLNGTNHEFSYDGSTDFSYNNTRSEIGHLFLELGNFASYDTTGAVRLWAGWNFSAFLDAGTGQNVSFLNLRQDTAYWEAETYAPSPTEAWVFGPGVQSTSNKSNPYRAWAVRDGDVLAVNEVPVPSALWLMGSGLLGLAGIARRKK